MYSSTTALVHNIQYTVYYIILYLIIACVYVWYDDDTRAYKISVREWGGCWVVGFNERNTAQPHHLEFCQEGYRAG